MSLPVFKVRTLFSLLLVITIATTCYAQNHSSTHNILEKSKKLNYKGHFSKGIRLLEESISETSGGHQLMLHLALGYSLLRQSFHKNQLDSTALKVFQEVEKQAIAKGYKKLQSAALNAQGFYYFKKGSDWLQQGLELLEKSRTIFPLGSDPALDSKNAYYTGIIYQRQDEHALAWAQFQQSLSASKEAGLVFMQGENERHIGYAYFFEKNFEEAVSHFETSLHLRNSIGYKDGAIFANVTLAQTLELMKQYPEAKKACSRAVKDAKSIKSDLGLARALGRLGSILVKMNNFKKAKKVLQKAISVGERINYRSVINQSKELLQQIN